MKTVSNKSDEVNHIVHLHWNRQKNPLFKLSEMEFVITTIKWECECHDAMNAKLLKMKLCRIECGLCLIYCNAFRHLSSSFGCVFYTQSDVYRSTHSHSIDSFFYNFVIKIENVQPGKWWRSSVILSNAFGHNKNFVFSRSDLFEERQSTISIIARWLFFFPSAWMDAALNGLEEEGKKRSVIDWLSSVCRMWFYFALTEHFCVHSNVCVVVHFSLASSHEEIPRM